MHVKPYYHYSVSGGTTWHAAGLINPIKGGINDIKLSQYAIDLFPKLEQETDASTGMTTETSQNLWLIKLDYMAAVILFTLHQIFGLDVIIYLCHRLEELWCRDGC